MNSRECRHLARRMAREQEANPRQIYFYPHELRANGPSVTMHDRRRLFKAGWKVEAVLPGSETAKNHRFRIRRVRA